MTEAERKIVRQRALGRCEYCHLPDSSLGASDFHVEHIIARQHGGLDNLDNAAWSCIFCNLYKGPNISTFDPDTGLLTALFHPRRQLWDEHFLLRGHILEGRTATGRASAWLLEMNSDLMTALRLSLIGEGLWGA